MKNKSLQLLTLAFLFIIIGFGLHKYTFSLSLAENRVSTDNKLNPIILVQSGASYIDPYPTWFIPGYSLWFQDGENALGPPDNEFALIYQDYGNGYLTLDFGLNQEIIDGTGSDFTILAQGGRYIIRIGDNLSTPFEIFENGTGGVTFSGNTSLDLSGTEYDTVRYVQVECSSEATVELDTIEAINYNQPTSETDPPQITGPEDEWVWSDQSSVQISWGVYDLHPWNYSIFVGDNLVEQGLWMDDTLVEYQVSLTDRSDTVEVTLVLDDLFGNRNEDTVEVEIRPSPSETSSDHTSDSSGEPTVFPLLSLLTGIMCVSLLKIRKRKVKEKLE